METPPGYIYDLNVTRIGLHFPNLQVGVNCIFKSLKGDDYNCAAFALNIEDEWIQFKDDSGLPDYKIETYVSFYGNQGFQITNSTEVENNIIKIAIYTNTSNEFCHVARQLSDGRWASKIGDWEDVEHTNLEVLGGRSYGKPAVIMQKSSS